MLLDLIAFGWFSGTTGGTSSFEVSPSRIQAVASTGVSGTVPDGLPLNAARWSRPLDPTDKKRYGFDWTPELDDAVQIASVGTVTISAAGVAHGVMSDPTYPPVIDDTGKIVGVRFIVDPSYRSDPAFLGQGLDVAIAMVINTTDGETMEISMILTVRQR